MDINPKKTNACTEDDEETHSSGAQLQRGER